MLFKYNDVKNADQRMIGNVWKRCCKSGKRRCNWWSCSVKPRRRQRKLSRWQSIIWTLMLSLLFWTFHFLSLVCYLHLMRGSCTPLAIKRPLKFRFLPASKSADLKAALCGLQIGKISKTIKSKCIVIHQQFWFRNPKVRKHCIDKISVSRRNFALFKKLTDSWWFGFNQDS